MASTVETTKSLASKDKSRVRLKSLRKLVQAFASKSLKSHQPQQKEIKTSKELSKISNAAATNPVSLERSELRKESKNSNKEDSVSEL